TIISATDRGIEFRQLVRIDVKTKAVAPVTREQAKWDVEEFELSPDGATLAYTLNEEGTSTLVFADAKTGERLQEWRELQVISHLRWHENGRDVGFAVDRANSPPDAWSVAFTRTSKSKIEPTRW